MSSRKDVQQALEEAATENKRMFQWKAANILQGASPVISRHLASQMLHDISPSEITTAAKRLHCSHCCALMTTARVRIRQPRKRRGRRNTVSSRNRVFRTCSMCQRVSVAVGTSTALDLTPVDLETMGQMKNALKSNKQKSNKREPSGKKKRKNNSKRLSTEPPPAPKQREGLAASFLFEAI